MASNDTSRPSHAFNAVYQDHNNGYSQEPVRIRYTERGNRLQAEARSNQNNLSPAPEVEEIEEEDLPQVVRSELIDPVYEAEKTRLEGLVEEMIRSRTVSPMPQVVSSHLIDPDVEAERRRLEGLVEEMISSGTVSPIPQVVKSELIDPEDEAERRRLRGLVEDMIRSRTVVKEKIPQLIKSELIDPEDEAERRRVRGLVEDLIRSNSVVKEEIPQVIKSQLIDTDDEAEKIKLEERARSISLLPYPSTQTLGFFEESNAVSSSGNSRTSSKSQAYRSPYPEMVQPLVRDERGMRSPTMAEPNSSRRPNLAPRNLRSRKRTRENSYMDQCSNLSNFPINYYHRQQPRDYRSLVNDPTNIMDSNSASFVPNENQQTKMEWPENQVAKLRAERDHWKDIALRRDRQTG
jgi:hypothetical protein